MTSILKTFVLLICALVVLGACQRIKFPYAGFKEEDAKREAPAYTYEPDINRSLSK